MSKSAFCAVLLAASFAAKAAALEDKRRCDACLLLGHELNMACSTAKPAKLPTEAWVEELIDGSVARASNMYIWAQPKEANRGWYKHVSAALVDYSGSPDVQRTLKERKVDIKRKYFLEDVVGQQDETVAGMMAMCADADGPGHHVSFFTLASVICSPYCDSSRLHPGLQDYPDDELIAYRRQFVSDDGTYAAVFDPDEAADL
ncbi:hypothetical protein DIPPA_30130 [Diplonema papillatum]|nr:hypothetical protein DIPPA_30130 [Diplonema papillatum]